MKWNCNNLFSRRIHYSHRATWTLRGNMLSGKFLESLRSTRISVWNGIEASRGVIISSEEYSHYGNNSSFIRKHFLIISSSREHLLWAAAKIKAIFVVVTSVICVLAEFVLLSAHSPQCDYSDLVPLLYGSHLRVTYCCMAWLPVHRCTSAGGIFIINIITLDAHCCDDCVGHPKQAETMETICSAELPP